MAFEFLPEEIRKKVLGQAEVIIGTIGHIDHGKTTLTKAITGKWTDTYSEELLKGITIKLGYANASIFYDKTKNPPEAYTTFPMHENVEFLRKISIIDSPGHEALMTVMLSGASIIDGAILVIAANEKCPRPQTVEHLRALRVIGVKDIIVVQNKIDLVSKDRAEENYKEIIEFLQKEGFNPEEIPIIPVSAFYNVNIDVLLEAIIKFIPKKERDLDSNPLFLITRSFDVNKPGIPPEKLKGGVLGGSLKRGKLKVGQEIEIVPGFVDNKGNHEPIYTTIESIHSGESYIEEAIPGGSVGIGTSLDPILTKKDRLVGNVVGLPGKTPEVYKELEIEPHLFERIVGEKGEIESISKELKKGERLVLTIWSAMTMGVVEEVRRDYAYIKLLKPVAAEKGERVVISRHVKGSWRLSGYGIILNE